MLNHLLNYQILINFGPKHAFAMKQLLSLLLLWCGLSALGAVAPDSLRFSFDYDGCKRTYGMYLPANLKPGAPLVVYVHGYGSKTRWVSDLNAAADKYGFAVCYPDGLPDTRGKEGWQVGYPPQSNITVDEAAYFRTLIDKVVKKFDLSHVNVFCAGMSNGGDLCYQLAYTDPTVFRAYASVAGLTFEYAYLPNRLSLPVPFMEIHGTADKTSMYEGDHENTGGWGAYIPVPLAVAAIAANNRCTTTTVDTVPSLPESGRTVIRTTYSGAPTGDDVVLYTIEGGKHSWAKADVPTSELIWQFFSRYLEKN